MKPIYALLTLFTFVLAMTASHLVFSKGHVPLGKVQMCHDGEVITVSINAMKAHLNHGDCRLPACDFNNVFFTGDACNSNNAGGKCTLPNLRDDACGVTPGCPAGAGCF